MLRFLRKWAHFRTVTVTCYDRIRNINDFRYVFLIKCAHFYKQTRNDRILRLLIPKLHSFKLGLEHHHISKLKGEMIYLKKLLLKVVKLTEFRKAGQKFHRCIPKITSCHFKSRWFVFRPYNYNYSLTTLHVERARSLSTFTTSNPSQDLLQILGYPTIFGSIVA